MATSYIEIEQEKQRAAAGFHPRSTERPRKPKPKFGFPAAVMHTMLAVQWPGCWRELTVCWRAGAGRTRATRMHASVVSYSSFLGWRGSGGGELCRVAEAAS